jgi:hypothetical protein
MHVGLGLPISDPPALLDWARSADADPFSTLALLDRLVYDNPEPLVTLAALAGATGRIRVQTEVLLAPLREPALMPNKSPPSTACRTVASLSASGSVPGGTTTRPRESTPMTEEHVSTRS